MCSAGDVIAEDVAANPFPGLGVVGESHRRRLDKRYVLDDHLGIGLADIGRAGLDKRPPCQKHVAAGLAVEGQPLAMRGVQVAQHQMRKVIDLGACLVNRPVTVGKPGNAAILDLVGQGFRALAADLEHQPVVERIDTKGVGANSIHQLRPGEGIPQAERGAPLRVKRYIHLCKLAGLVDQLVTAVEEGFRAAGFRAGQLAVDVQDALGDHIEIFKVLVDLCDDAVLQLVDAAGDGVEGVRHGFTTVDGDNARPHLGRHVADIVKAGKEGLQRRADIGVAGKKKRLKLFQRFKIGAGCLCVGAGIPRLVQQEFIKRTGNVGNPHAQPAVVADAIDTTGACRHFLKRGLAPLVAVGIDVGDVLASDR